MPHLALLDVAGGAVSEQLEDALQRVLANVTDVNTEATGTRTITAKWTLKPTDDRTLIVCEVDVQTKLTAPRKVATRFFVGHDANGCLVAQEEHPTQMRMAFDAMAGASVAGIAGREEE